MKDTSERSSVATQSKGTAVVTGASSGIGALYADRLARRGYDLILVGRNVQRLKGVAAQLVSRYPTSVTTLPADLGNPADLRRVEDVLHSNSSCRMLVNNAGMGLYAPVLSSNIDAMQQLIELNIVALTRLSVAAAKRFAERGSGAIVNIGSVVALSPERLNGVYAGTKSFVLAFSQSLRKELADRGVRVHIVLPGATATEFWANAGKPVEELPPEIVMSAEVMVDAALAGFDLGENVTIPALPNIEDWEAFEACRLALQPNLSRSRPAARYRASL